MYGSPGAAEGLRNAHGVPRFPRWGRHLNDMSLKQLYEADWASAAVASSSDEDKEQIRHDLGLGEKEGGGGTPCCVHGTIGGTPCGVHGTILGHGGTPCGVHGTTSREASLEAVSASAAVNGEANY
jgi:hypothetical protein